MQLKIDELEEQVEGLKTAAASSGAPFDDSNVSEIKTNFSDESHNDTEMLQKMIDNVKAFFARVSKTMAGDESNTSVFFDQSYDTLDAQNEVSHAESVIVDMLLKVAARVGTTVSGKVGEMTGPDVDFLEKLVTQYKESHETLVDGTPSKAKRPWLSRIRLRGKTS